MITFIIMVLSNILEFSIFYKFNTKVFISKKDNIYIFGILLLLYVKQYLIY